MANSSRAARLVLPRARGPFALSRAALIALGLSRTLPVLSLPVVLSLPGCARDAQLTTSSADQGGYTESFAARVSAVRGEIDEQEKLARADFDTFRALPSKLKGADLAVVRGLVERADKTGRSSYYAEQALDREAAERLLESDRRSIGRRVASAVKKRAQEKECSAEDADALGNTGAYALQRAADQKLDARRKAQNDVLRDIERSRERIGAANVRHVEEAVEATSRASFLAHVRLELYRRELEALLDEERAVKRTLERALEDDRRTLADPNLSAAQRKAIDARMSRIEEAQRALDVESPIAHAALKVAPERIEALRKDYQGALDATLTALTPPKGEPRVGTLRVESR